MAVAYLYPATNSGTRSPGGTDRPESFGALFARNDTRPWCTLLFSHTSHQESAMRRAVAILQLAAVMSMLGGRASLLASARCSACVRRLARARPRFGTRQDRQSDHRWAGCDSQHAEGIQARGALPGSQGTRRLEDARRQGQDRQLRFTVWFQVDLIYDPS